MNQVIKSDEKKISAPKPQNSLKKSNPKEYYVQSCIKFSELRRDSEKTAKSIDKLNSERSLFFLFYHIHLSKVLLVYEI